VAGVVSGDAASPSGESDKTSIRKRNAGVRSARQKMFSHQRGEKSVSRSRLFR
jgi:hypothetical protein